MSSVKIALAALLLGLTGLWFMADSLYSTPFDYRAFRDAAIQLSGILALGAMCAATLLAARPVWLEPAFGGLDKMYRLHKWLGIAALVASVGHWWFATGSRLFSSGGEGPHGPRGGGEQTLSLIDSLRGLSHPVGEWGFYLVVALVLIALLTRIPYRWFAYSHIVITPVFLALVFHGVLLATPAYWSQPVGWALALLCIAGVAAAAVVLARRFGILPGRGRGVLKEGERIGAAFLSGRPGFGHGQARGSGIGIPALELGQIAPGRVLENLQPVFDRGRVAIVAVKIEVERLFIAVIADKPLQHPDDLGALFIDGRGIEVVDLDIAVGPDGMGKGAHILAELAGAQCQHIVDALDRGRAHVRRELLIAKDGQALFQAKLEPVAAGDPVARPVVEIFMRDHAFDPFEIGIGRGFGAGQNKPGVENVQSLVLHRSGVEVIDGDDVENVQIVFAAIYILVPLHRADEAVHRIGAAVLIAVADPDVQRDLAARCRGECVRDRFQVTRDQREEIGGLWPGIVPFGPAGAGP